MHEIHISIKIAPPVKQQCDNFSWDVIVSLSYRHWAFCLANESKRQRQEKRVVQQLLLPKTAYFVIVKRSNSEIQCTNWRTIILHCFTPCLRSNTSLVPILQSPEILTLSRFQTKTASIFQFKTWMAFVLAFSWFKSFIQFENKQQAMEKKLLQSLNSRF